jgi:hypothetical protein
MLFFCGNAWSAEVTCLVANFKAALDTPAPIREAAAYQWLKERGGECSYEQLTAIKNNLGNWMGVANSYRISVQLQHHLESYYVAKNEWSESLYTSEAAYVAPYTARTLTAETNVIVAPPMAPRGPYGQGYTQSGYDPNSFNQQQGYNYQSPATTDGGYQNNYQSSPQDTYADPNSAW